MLTRGLRLANALTEMGLLSSNKTIEAFKLFSREDFVPETDVPGIEDPESTVSLKSVGIEMSYPSFPSRWLYCFFCLFYFLFIVKLILFFVLFLLCFFFFFAIFSFE